MKYLNVLKIPVLLSLVLMVLCGLVYPMALTGIAQVALPRQANGSLLMADGAAVGSTLVGQDFTDARFLQGRPSAVGYNTYTAEEKVDGSYGGVASGSSNYGPSNPALTQRVEEDMEAFLAAHPGVKAEEIPTDLLTASGSGLDPHISPAAAKIQIPALAQNTGLTEADLQAMVDEHTQGKLLGIFGEEQVNVLQVNLSIAQALGLVGE